MAATSLYSAVSLLLFGIHLLSMTSDPCIFQDKFIEFGLNITLASKRPIETGLEAVNRSRHDIIRSAILQPTSRNPSRRLLLSLLFLSGNIEVNPGPHYKNPCGECSRPVKRNQNGIQCDQCDVWYHANCSSISLPMYEILANTSLTWICPQCGFPNFSDSFFNESIESLASSNSFEPLQESSIENSTPIKTVNRNYINKQTRRSKPTKCKLSCLSVNCRSIKNKVADIAAIVEEYKPDIILGNESWLYPDIANAEIFPENYNVYRKDRITDNHGGVFQAVKKDILITHREDLDTDCEIIWTQCQIKNKTSKSVFFASFYRPNKNDINSLEELDSSLFKLGDRLNSNNIIVAGDFNTPDLKWDDLETTNCSSNSERFLEIIDEHGLTQLVKEPTRENNIIDLVLTNNDNIINNVKVVPGISDHGMVLFEVQLACRTKKPVKRKIYLRKKANTTRITNELQDFIKDFGESVSETESIDTKWNMFQQRITEIMDSCIPHKFTTSRHNLPWFDRNLRRQTRKKQKLYNKAKKTGRQTDWNKFKVARKQLNKNLNMSRNNYLSGFLGDSLKQNPKAFWTHLKKLGKESTDIQDLKVGNEVITDPKAKAEALNKQFASVFNSDDTDTIPDPGANPIPTIGALTITTYGVEKQLRGLKADKAYGPDGIPPWFLKENAQEISKILTDIYQHCINSGTVPNQWKHANVCAVYKKGKKSDPSNYRPISLTCIASKVLEHIVHSHVMKHLAQYGVLTDYQHGFRAKRSTETQLICTIHDIASTIQSNKSTHAAILDFSKAFDKVPHRRLLKKLDYYGIRGSLHNWFKSFLTQRTQSVVYEGKSSTPVMTTSGVPQGTVLGPLLFLTYINDLPDGLHSTVRLFADDALVYGTISCNEDTADLQDDLYRLEAWQQKWKMQFNPSKCKVMCFSTKRDPPKREYVFCGEILEQVKSHPYLGVMLDSKMRWSPHIDKITSKANSVLGLVKRNLWNCPKSVKETAYMILVKPKLQYACTAWDPHFQRDKAALERVQRKAARFVTGNYERTSSVTAMLQALNWHTLETQRTHARLTTMFKMCHGLLDGNWGEYLKPNQERRTRGSHNFKFIVPKGHKDIFRFSFFPRTIVDWNNLDNETVLSESLPIFKNKLTKFL